jgi:hypothetical protein
MSFACAVEHALRAVLADDGPAWIAACGEVPYDARPVSMRFADARTLLRALDHGDPEALGCVVVMATASRPCDVTSALALAVLGDASLHRDELLVLVCLRHLVTDPRPEALQAALPFLARRWCAAQTGLDRSPSPRRAELLADALERAEPFMAREAHAWPTRDDPARPWPDEGDEPPVVGRLIEDVWPDAPTAVRERLRAFVMRYHDRAATQRARLDAARTRLHLGDAAGVEGLTGSAIPLLRAYGLSSLLEHAPLTTLAREAARLFTPGGDRDELTGALGRWRHIAVCPSPDGAHVAVAVTGRAQGAGGEVPPGRTRVGWLHATSGAWVHTWDLPLRLYEGARLSLPAARGVVVLLQGSTREGAARRYLFVDATGAPAWATTAQEMKSRRGAPR